MTPDELREKTRDQIDEQCRIRVEGDTVWVDQETLLDWFVKQAEPDSKIWLNAMRCVSPADEFAMLVGRDIIEQVMRDGHPKQEPLDPFRRLTIEVVAS